MASPKRRNKKATREGARLEARRKFLTEYAKNLEYKLTPAENRTDGKSNKEILGFLEAQGRDFLEDTPALRGRS